MSSRLVNDMGIPITGEGNVYLDIKGCGNAFLILSKSIKFSNKNGSYYLIALGTGTDRRINTFKESCVSCPEAKAENHEKILDCERFNKFWVSWNDNGNIQFGRGRIVNQRVLMEYTGKAKFTLNYLFLLSSKYKIQWKIISG